MHVVEHTDDLFSLKKYNNYMHILTLLEPRFKDIIEHGNEMSLQKYNVFTLLAADSALSRLE
jgi:hypothetical protein